MHVDNRVWYRPVQLGHAPGHRARVPVLEHAARTQPQIELLIRAFCSGLVGTEDDPGLLVRPAVEGHALTLLDVGIIAFTESPERLFAPNNRPAKSTCLMIESEVR